MYSFAHMGQHQLANVENHNQVCFLKAHDKYDIDMANFWMIGDKEADISATNTTGINNAILVKSRHNIDEANSKAKIYIKIHSR
jgi:histidinol phosphatase-like enzyme